MSQPFIKEKDISIDTSFDCFRSSMNGNAYHPVGMR